MLQIAQSIHRSPGTGMASAIARLGCLPYSVHIHLRVGLRYCHPAWPYESLKSFCGMHRKLLVRFRALHASEEVLINSLDAHQPLLSLYGFLNSCACIIVKELSVVP